MKNEKVFIEGYVVGFNVDSLGTIEKRIQVVSGETVSIDENFIYKSIEPEKVKVPWFVADWYEKHKDDLEYDIWEYILHWGKQQKSEFYEWMNHANNKPFQTLINMHQFGYKVEKEKRYRVKMKGMSEENTYLTFRFGHTWMLSNFEECEEFRLHHTRKELEDANFGWVFDCPGIEIEEAE